jgi:hypothetical protein
MIVSQNARVTVEIEGAEPVVLEGVTVEQTTSHAFGKPATHYVILRAVTPALPFPVRPAPPE